jgi:uncharacterized protein (UPF0548 family)
VDHGPFWLRPPGPDQLRSLVRAARDEALSYPDPGGTRSDPLPAGYHHVDRSIALGNAPDAFDRAVAGIRAWAPQRNAGIDLLPPVPSIVEGETLLLAFHQFPFFVTAACRIVYVVDEPDRFGFGYGTLPHHPEQGEEAFIAERDPATGTVRFTIRAFSRPAHLLTKLGGPVGRIVQVRVTRRYLQGLRKA